LSRFFCDARGSLILGSFELDRRYNATTTNCSR
jgi:hypothetical protein